MKITHDILNLAFIFIMGLCVEAIDDNKPLRWGPPNDLQTCDSEFIDYRDLDNTTIQWTYKHDTSIKLLSPDCEYLNFPSGKPGVSLLSQDCDYINFRSRGQDVSLLRILFKSSDYRRYLDAKYFFVFEVQCSDDNTKDKMMIKLLDMETKSKKPYIRTTIAANQCPTGLITKMRLYAVRNVDDQPNPHVNGWKDVNSPPCSSINNFMTVPWPKEYISVK